MDWHVWAIGAAIIISIATIHIYIYRIKDWLAYRRAKRDIFAFVESYKRKCTGNNRYVVTVESLQDSFREYNTPVIRRVWLDLIATHMIEPDPQDQVWCVR
jgi:hypothetical protein